MKKKVYIIHGWDGSPENGWFPWLKQELEKRGWEVTVPELPQSEEPRIKNWIPKMVEVIGIPDENTYFVGHSMGCQAIVRFLETLPETTLVGGAVFVAGFFTRLTMEEDDLTQDVGREWLGTPLDLGKVKKHMRKSVAIFSDDDPYVPIENKEKFETILGSKIILKPNMKHFSGSEGVTELPVVLESLLEISN